MKVEPARLVVVAGIHIRFVVGAGTPARGAAGYAAALAHFWFGSLELADEAGFGIW